MNQYSFSFSKRIAIILVLVFVLVIKLALVQQEIFVTCAWLVSNTKSYQAFKAKANDRPQGQDQGLTSLLVRGESSNDDGRSSNRRRNRQRAFLSGQHCPCIVNSEAKQNAWLLLCGRNIFKRKSSHYAHWIHTLGILK